MADAKVIPFGDDPRARRGSVARPGHAPKPSAKQAARSTGGAVKRAQGPARKPGPLAPVPEQQGERDRQDAGGRDGFRTVRGNERLSRADETAGPAAAAASAEGEEAVRVQSGRSDWERRIAGGLAFLRRRVTGDYEVDEFGYDKELTDQVLMSLIRPLHDKYFRVEVKGIENIPSEGGALVVANHSGTLPLDGLMMQVAVHDKHPAGRHLRLLAADLLFMLPVVNELARKAGHTLACADDAERLLRRGEVVGVMPEGFKGIGKPFGERYKLQRFGRGGFVSTALRRGCADRAVLDRGGRGDLPDGRQLQDAGAAARDPRTSRSRRRFRGSGRSGRCRCRRSGRSSSVSRSPTDRYSPEAADDPMLMFNLTDQVREQIQHTLYKLLVRAADRCSSDRLLPRAKWRPLPGRGRHCCAVCGWCRRSAADWCCWFGLPAVVPLVDVCQSASSESMPRPGSSPGSSGGRVTSGAGPPPCCLLSSGSSDGSGGRTALRRRLEQSAGVAADQPFEGRAAGRRSRARRVRLLAARIGGARAGGGCAGRWTCASRPCRGERPASRGARNPGAFPGAWAAVTGAGRPLRLWRRTPSSLRCRRP